jgi:PhnB protein
MTPYFIVKDAEGFLGFLVRAFGAEVISRFHRPDGTLMHAQVRVFGAGAEVSESGGAWPPSSHALHVFVEDVDGLHARAVAAGAHSTLAPTDHPYGERGACLRDSWGNQWFLARQTEVVSHEELSRRMQEKSA